MASNPPKTKPDDILVPLDMVIAGALGHPAPNGIMSNTAWETARVKSCTTLQNALAWLADNPIIPSETQLEEIDVDTESQVERDRLDRIGAGQLGVTQYSATRARIVEFQRIMFLKPKQVYPPEVAELLCDEDLKGDYLISRTGFNKLIVEAYKLGLGDKPNPDDDDNPDHPGHDARTT